METITRKRRAVITDPYSNEPTGLGPWDSAAEAILDGEWAVEPRPSSEPVQDARNAVVSGFTLYGPYEPDLTPQDRVLVRGNWYDVDGVVANWADPFTDQEVGSVVQTKVVDG